MRTTTATATALTWAALILSPIVASGHGGGLDSHGCHRDSSAGDYHCHDGPHEGESFTSKAAYPGRADRTDGEYDREAYHPGWADFDEDCQDTRQEVLIAHSVEPVDFGPDGCRVESGRWEGPYTGETFTDPSNLDIDHVVPLQEAHESGAADWPQRRKRRFANDTDGLLPVEAGANRSKGSRGPGEWLPPDDSYHCGYVETWIEIKDEWGLRMDPAERETVQKVLSDC